MSHVSRFGFSKVKLCENVSFLKTVNVRGAYDKFSDVFSMGI